MLVKFPMPDQRAGVDTYYLNPPPPPPRPHSVASHLIHKGQDPEAGVANFQASSWHLLCSTFKATQLLSVWVSNLGSTLMSTAFLG